MGYRKRVKLPEPEVIIPVMLDNGQVLNSWESKVHVCLTELNWRFTAQAGFGPARALGGALVDFLLLDFYPYIDLDPAGPWHYTTEGQTRDFWREVNRTAFNIRHVLMPPETLAYSKGRLKQWIVETCGKPARTTKENYR